MRAVTVINQGQSSQDLNWIDCDEPTLGAGDVLVKTAYFGINRPDILQRRGLYPLPADASPILGLELSGHIVKLGSDIDQSWLNQPVMALCHGGAYAQFVKLDHRHIMPIPNGWDLSEAAGLPEALITVFANLVEDGGLKAGQKLLVHGGNSGIGAMAIMVARALSVSCVATARGDDKCNFARECGANLVIDNQGDFGWTRQLAAFGAVDMVLDMLGGDYLSHNLMALAPQGRHINIGFQTGAQSLIPLGLIMTRRLLLTGSLLRPRSADEKAYLIKQALLVLGPHLDKKANIRPTIHKIYDAKDIRQAHQDLEDGVIMGKAVVKLSGA